MVPLAEGIAPQDKGSGKAMPYADKYALMKAYKISTGDDPDQNASVETHYSNVRAGSAEQPKAQQKTPRQQLIAKLNEKGIDVNVYAKEHNLNGKTDNETFIKLLKELENA